MAEFKVLITDYAWPDVSIERNVLEAIDAELVVADQSDVESLIALASDVDAIMTNWAQTPAKVIGASGKCRIVSRLGIGLDNIDVDYCTANGIPVTNVPDYCVIEVAEHALAQMLSLARKIAFYHYETQNGRYELQSGPTLRRIEGQTLGIYGFGNIGRYLARKAMGLGLKVVAYSRSRKGPMDGVDFVEFDELLARSDYVSINAPLTDETRNAFGSDAFRKMKSTAYLINTARGGLVDHAALAEALADHQIAGAALDVQVPEPPDLSLAPYNDPRVLVSPHAAFVSLESLENLRSRAATQVATRLTGGLPENVVNAATISWPD